MTVVEELQAARNLIEDPHKWTQKAYARNSQGSMVDPRSCASCFCAYGAICNVSGAGSFQVSTIHSARLLEDVMGDYPHRYNDTHTHAEVLAMFDRAIELAKANAAE